MSVRQDKVQISIAFLTDESKAFAKMVEENKKFISDIKQARKEGKDLTDIIQKMTASGKEIAKIPLDKLAPAQLILRAQQLKQVLDLIPRSAPEYKQLEAEYKKINDQLADMRSRTKGVAQAMNEARTNQGTFLNGMTAMVGKAMILWYALKTLIGSLFKPSQLSSEMEQALISFETMLGSARNARKLVNEIVTLAANTPFETAELTDYVKRLLAMGIESKNVIGNLRQLGDIAAGVGKEKLPQIVLAFGQVATKTKLAGGELKQFTEAGVPLIAELAKQLNVSESQIFKLVEAGKIGFKDVEKAIANMTAEGGKFAGLMGKQAQTTEGLMSTLKDNISLTLAAFGDGFNQALKDILRSSIAFTNGLDRDKIRAWGEAVGNAVKFLFEFGPALLRIISIYGAYKVAVLAADTAQNLFSKSLKTNPFGLLISGITVAINLSQMYYENLSKLSERQELLNETTREAARDAKIQIEQYTDLFAVIRSGATSYDKKQAAVKRILELNPKYLGDINTEKELLTRLDEAQRRVNEAIIDEAIARVQAQKIQEKTGELIDLNLKKAEQERQLLEKRTAFSKEQSKPRATFPGAGNDSYENTGLLGAGADLLAAEKSMKQTDAAIEKTRQGIIQFGKDIGSVRQSVVKALDGALPSSLTPLENRLKSINDEIAKTNDSKAKAALENQKANILRQITLTTEGIIKEDAIKSIAAENDEKAAEQARKKELKALKDQYDILLKEDEVQYQKRLLLFERAFFQKSISESDFAKKENTLTSTHYENMIGIYEGYLSRLTASGQAGSEEYLNIEKKKFETERQLAENRAQLRRPAALETERLPGTQNTEGVSSPIGSALTTIQDLANVEKTVMANRFRDLVFGEQQLQIARLQVQKDAYDKQLALLTEAGLKDTKQYEAIAKKKEQTDNDLFKNKERLKDLELQMEEAKMSLLNDSLVFAIDILARDEAARKKNATALKAFQTGQVIINGIAEVSKIWAVHGANPILAGILTAAAALRSVGAITKIAATKFARGGFTGAGNAYRDETGHTPVGIVHNDEWVGPKWMTQNPQLRPMFNMMEQIRLRGYADGGFVNTTPTFNLNPSSITNAINVDMGALVSEFKGLRNDVRQWQTRLKAEVYRDEFEAQADQDAADRRSAAL